MYQKPFSLILERDNVTRDMVSLTKGRYFINRLYWHNRLIKATAIRKQTQGEYILTFQLVDNDLAFVRADKRNRKPVEMKFTLTIGGKETEISLDINKRGVLQFFGIRTTDNSATPFWINREDILKLSK